MSEFTIIIASDDEHEKVFAEILFSERFVAIVNQEKGLECLEIEFPPLNVDTSMVERRVDFEDFIKALSSAAKRLVGENHQSS